MLSLLECAETEPAADIDRAALETALAAITGQYTIDRQNETIRTKTGPAPKKRTEALGVISAYSNIPGLAPEAAAQLKGIANSIKNGNNALIAAITKTKPATEAAFAGADISAWSKIVHTNINAGEKGIVMLAAQGNGGTV
jgi:hypothetical protein